MAPVGRPRKRTKSGSSPPTTELGIPDVQYGSGVNLSTGGIANWSDFVDQHEFVQELRWPNSIKLYDQMRTDTQLAALFTAVAWGISQLRYLIDENGAKPKIVKGISEDLNLQIRGKDDQPRGRLKKRFSHGKFIAEALLSLIYGHMYYEQVGEIVDGMWRLRKLAARMPQSIKEIRIAEDGGLISIVQYPSFNMNQDISPPEIPVDRLVAFIFQQEGPNWAGRSMFRDCYKDWLIKDRLVRIDAINHERAGGVPYVEAPPGATPGEIEDLNQMAQSFRVGESSGGALPFGATLQIAKGTGSDVDKSIHSRDESMARRFLLQLMNLAQSGQHVGSYALGETFEDFFVVGQRHIAQWYCDTMTEHLIEDWVDWNYGEDEEQVPQLTWERTSEDALGVEQLSMLVQRGVIEVDDEFENAIRYKYRLPKRTSPRQDIVTPGGPRQPTEQQAVKTGVESGPGAPSSQPSTPAPKPAAKKVAASLEPYNWERDPEYGQPHVMAAGPHLVTVPNVPILEAGVEYKLSTGKTTFTPEDLADAVCAANEDPSIPSPRVKLGHIDPRFNGPEYDADPSFGLCKNLRLNENGTVIYADHVGVPKWLADILPLTYPGRSVEGFWGVDSHAGKKWRFVISACSLLGVKWPGITQLDELPNYLGDEIPEGVVVASGGDPMKTKASANLDNVRRAFYSDYVTQASGAKWWWIRAVLTDPNELVCEDDESGDLFKIPFEADDKGNVSFGEAKNVRLEYIPDDQKKAAASHVAAALVTGRMVMAQYDTRAESSPEEGGGMDPAKIRERLGLPEDATDEEVQEALAELDDARGEATKTGQFGGAVPVGSGSPEELAEATKVGDASPDAPITPTVQPSGQPDGDPDVADANAANPATTASSGGDPTVMLDRATFENLKAGAQAGLDLKASSDKDKREGLVAAAIGDGRIPPARKDYWLGALEKDFEGFSQSLATLAPGLIPVEEKGNGTTEETLASGPDVVLGWTDSLFPEVAARRERATAIQEKRIPVPQIMREEGH